MPIEIAGRHDVLGDFFGATVSRKSFCGPDEWGSSAAHHGPFLSDARLAEFLTPIGAEELAARVLGALSDPNFSGPPSPEQCWPVIAWVERARIRCDSIFVLEVPKASELRLDFNIWSIHYENIVVSEERREFDIGVIGLD